MNESAWTINKYLPIAVIYFFFNSFLLPHGLLYTTLLTPFLLVWLLKFNPTKSILFFVAAFVPFAFVHFSNGVDAGYYVRSSVLLFTVFVFILAFYHFLRVCHSIRTIYKNLLLINFLLVIFAVLALVIPDLREIFWYNNQITEGTTTIRLQLFTYEPSYYSTLLAPIALYYYVKAIMGRLPRPVIIITLVTAPLLLSLSFGIILGILITLVVLLLTHPRSLLKKKRVFFLVAGSFTLLVLALIAGFVFFPDNIFFTRIENVFAGKDSSFRGRTLDSFNLGWHYAKEKSLLFGCGPGQAKVIGLEYFRDYYKHPAFTMENVRIPNVLGDTLATFGLVGLSIRMVLEVVLFFKTKVYSNYYRLSLFLFIFIYQFTGSFLTNIAEYAIWVMAFYSGGFMEFDKPGKKADA